MEALTYIPLIFSGFMAVLLVGFGVWFFFELRRK